jgi:hypothetical protein
MGQAGLGALSLVLGKKTTLDEELAKGFDARAVSVSQTRIAKEAINRTGSYQIQIDELVEKSLGCQWQGKGRGVCQSGFAP